MTKQECINNWQSSARESWISAVYLAVGEHFNLSLFALNLSIEKVLKAIWIKKSLTHNPPDTHDLRRLVDELGLDFQPEDYEFLSVINSWNIHGQFPVYANHLNISSTPDYLQEQLDKTHTLKIWLEKKI